ncbi:hypothetical protein PoB_005554600, partial [Plakobranchus ocellatus]
MRKGGKSRQDIEQENEMLQMRRTGKGKESQNESNEFLSQKMRGWEIMRSNEQGRIKNFKKKSMGGWGQGEVKGIRP